MSASFEYAYMKVISKYFKQLALFYSVNSNLWAYLHTDQSSPLIFYWTSSCNWSWSISQLCENYILSNPELDRTHSRIDLMLTGQWSYKAHHFLPEPMFKSSPPSHVPIFALCLNFFVFDCWQQVGVFAWFYPSYAYFCLISSILCMFLLDLHVYTISTAWLTSCVKLHIYCISQA